MTRMTLKAYNELLKKKGVNWAHELSEEDQKAIDKKAPKYNNIKVERDGYIFDSKKECNFYCQCKLEKRAGKILDFEVKPEKFILQPGFREQRTGKWILPITYTADFKIIKLDQSIEYVDTKGVRTKEFNIKLKMFKYIFPDKVIRLE